jgi:uncharacterized protein (TIGR02271 family)
MFDQDTLGRLPGSTAHDRNGESVGKVKQLYVDDESGQPKWATVATGLFGTSESFVPLEQAELDGEGNLRLAYDKDTVKDAPRVDADGHIEESEEARLYEHYGLGGTAASGVMGGDRDVDADRSVPVDHDRDETAGTAPAAGEGTSMTRNEERLQVGTEQVETGRLRLRKYVTTEDQTVSVPVKKEKLVVDRQPLDGDQARSAGVIGDTGEEVEEITLREERPVVDKETVAVEEVSVGKETVTEEHTVSDTIRKEQVDLEEDGTVTGRDDV